MPPRVRNKADKQARIAAAARALFEERGFEATTIRAIAERAEVATGTVLLYGESKAELLTALFVEELAEILDAQERTLDPAAPLEDQLAHLFSGLLDRYASHPALSRVYVKETLFQSPSPQADRYEAITAAFLVRLTELVASAPLRAGVEPPAVALAAFGVYLVHVITLLRQPANPIALVRLSLRDALGRLVGPLRP